MSGNRTIVEYETMSGVVLHITPLSLRMLQALIARAKELYPDIDREPYETPLKNAVDPSIKRPAEDNVEYRQLQGAVENQRWTWINEQGLDMAVEYRDYRDNRAALVEYFAPQLNRARKALDLPDDDYQAVTEYFLYSGKDDRTNVVKIVFQEMPLTGGEIADAMRIFRPDLSRRSPRKGDSGSSSLQTA